MRIGLPSPPPAANDDVAPPAARSAPSPAPPPDDPAAAWTFLAALTAGLYVSGFTGSFALGAGVLCIVYLLGWMARELLRRRRA